MRIKKEEQTIGHRIECEECGHVGKDRVYQEGPPLSDGRYWHDTEKSEKVCNLDKARHYGAATKRRGARPRDTQRQKAYAAERAAFIGTRWDATIGNGSVEATQAWLNEVTSSRWFRSRWGLTFQAVRILPGSGGNHARYKGNITVGHWGRKPWVVLHELAHVLASPQSLAGHAKQWAGVYVFLVENVLGVEAARALRAQFVAKKVKHRDSSYIPAAGTERVPTKTQVTAAKRREAAHFEKALLSTRSKQMAAQTIRAAVKEGLFGASGTKQRASALAVARSLDPVSPRK